jgi:hypothetical protein
MLCSLQRCITSTLSRSALAEGIDYRPGSPEPGFHRVSLAIMSDDKSTGGLDILLDAAV